MFGLLNINKPSGMTSRDVVDRVQRLVRPAKAGHAGTLDPLASGVLVVCVGPATRLVPYIQKMPKHYQAAFLLGRESDTEDVEGSVVEVACSHQPSRDELQEVLRHFIGKVSQRPPNYSALKIKGQRAYKLARAGKRVELAARTVTIHDLRLVSYEYPQLRLDVVCGSGTYVRSLGRDIAAQSGTTAVMSALARTAIGCFRLEESIAAETLATDGAARHLLPASLATEGLPAVTLTDGEIRKVTRGMTIENQFKTSVGEIAAMDTSGQLVAILVPRGRGWLGPVRNFVAAKGAGGRHGP